MKRKIARFVVEVEVARWRFSSKKEEPSKEDVRKMIEARLEYEDAFDVLSVKAATPAKAEGER